VNYPATQTNFAALERLDHVALAAVRCEFHVASIA
jgi:hypothetical protein